jgi:predicted transcriptional regulator
MTKHLAIFSKPAIDQIFSGQKTIETRFSQKRISPFQKVSTGDIVYMKQPGQDVSGQFTVKKVITFENLDQTDWELIKQSYGKSLSLGSEQLDQKFFAIHKNAKYGTIIFIDQVEQLITSPTTYKKRDQRAWVVLE